MKVLLIHFKLRLLLNSTITNADVYTLNFQQIVLQMSPTSIQAKMDIIFKVRLHLTLM